MIYNCVKKFKSLTSLLGVAELYAEQRIWIKKFLLLLRRFSHTKKMNL